MPTWDEWDAAQLRRSAERCMGTDLFAPTLLFRGHNAVKCPLCGVHLSVGQGLRMAAVPYHWRAEPVTDVDFNEAATRALED